MREARVSACAQKIEAAVFQDLVDDPTADVPSPFPVDANILFDREYENEKFEYEGQDPRFKADCRDVRRSFMERRVTHTSPLEHQ